MAGRVSETSEFDPYLAKQQLRGHGHVGGEDDGFSATSSFNPFSAPQRGGKVIQDDGFSATSPFDPFAANQKGGNANVSATSPYYYMGTGGKVEEGEGIDTDDIYRLLKESDDDKQVGGHNDNVFLDTSNEGGEDDSDLDIEKYMKKQSGGGEEDDYNTSDINIASYHSS